MSAKLRLEVKNTTTGERTSQGLNPRRGYAVYYPLGLIRSRDGLQLEASRFVTIGVNTYVPLIITPGEQEMTLSTRRMSRFGQQQQTVDVVPFDQLRLGTLTRGATQGYLDGIFVRRDEGFMPAKLVLEEDPKVGQPVPVLVFSAYRKGMETYLQTISREDEKVSGPLHNHRYANVIRASILMDHLTTRLRRRDLLEGMTGIQDVSGRYVDVEMDIGPESLDVWGRSPNGEAIFLASIPYKQMGSGSVLKVAKMNDQGYLDFGTLHFRQERRLPN